MMSSAIDLLESDTPTLALETESVEFEPLLYEWGEFNFSWDEVVISEKGNLLLEILGAGAMEAADEKLVCKGIRIEEV